MSDSSDPAVWFLRSRGRERGREYGPFAGAALRSMAEAGRVGPADAVRKTGGPWKPATEVRGLLPTPAPEPAGDRTGGTPDAAPAAPPPAPRPAPEPDRRPAPPPAVTNEEPAEVIDARELAAVGIGDDPDPPPAYGNLRVYSAYLKVAGIVHYFFAGLIVVAAVLLAAFGGSGDGSALVRVSLMIFAAFGGCLLALPVAVAGFLLRCLSEGVGLLVNLATDTRAVRDHLDARG